MKKQLKRYLFINSEGYILDDCLTTNPAAIAKKFRDKSITIYGIISQYKNKKKIKIDLLNHESTIL